MGPGKATSSSTLMLEDWDLWCCTTRPLGWNTKFFARVLESLTETNRFAENVDRSVRVGNRLCP